MKILNASFLCILVTVACLLVGCGSPADTNIAKVRKGMSEFEVLDLMGIPDKARTEFQATSLGPLGTSKLFMYKGTKNWHRVVIFGSVVLVDSSGDGSEDRQFPIVMEIV